MDMFDSGLVAEQPKGMPRMSRKLFVIIGLICILLALVYLTVREVGQFSALFTPGTGLKAQRAAISQQILLLAIALMAAFAAIRLKNAPRVAAPLAHVSETFDPLSSSISSLRC